MRKNAVIPSANQDDRWIWLLLATTQGCGSRFDHMIKGMHTRADVPTSWYWRSNDSLHSSWRNSASSFTSTFSPPTFRLTHTLSHSLSLLYVYLIIRCGNCCHHGDWLHPGAVGSLSHVWSCPSQVSIIAHTHTHTHYSHTNKNTHTLQTHGFTLCTCSMKADQIDSTDMFEPLLTTVALLDSTVLEPCLKL